MILVYAIEYIDKPFIYVGASVNPEERWRAHKRGDGNELLYLDIQKYGESAFKRYTIEVCCPDTAEEREVYWMSKYSETHTLYNVYTEWGYRVTEKTRQVLSESKLGELNPMYQAGEKHPMYGAVLSEETRRKISEANIGEKNPFYGKKPTEEVRQKLIDANIGNKHSEETRAKLRAAWEERRKRPISEESRKKMSDSQKRRWEDVHNSQ